MELLAPMRLYTLTRRHFVLVFVSFLLLFGVTVLIGAAGPKIIIQNSYSVLNNRVNTSKFGPFHLKSPTLSNYNQQLWLVCSVQLDQKNEILKKTFEMNVELKGVLQDGSIRHIHRDVYHKSRTLTCTPHQVFCDDIIVVHLGYLAYTQYQINISLQGLEDLSQNIHNLTFVIKTYNPNFSQMEIWFRFVFVAMTFSVTCLFAHSLRKFSMRDWGIEQKWMSFLLPLLLLYNDPFFPLSFLTNSWFPGTLDTFFQAFFLCSLLLFWLCVYHGIRVQGNRKCLTFYIPKLVIVGLLLISAVTLGVWQLINELQDPTYQYNIDIQHFQGMKMFFFFVVALYILYLIFLFLRAWSELKNMPYSELRVKFLTALTLLVLVISVVILYLRFGSKALQDNFVAELSTNYQNSVEFSSFYGLLNFYLYTLAFIYSPASNAVYDSQMKDNPAFSMLNESDDEVIYGSDFEEMPLQNGRAIKTKSNYRDEVDSD